MSQTSRLVLKSSKLCRARGYSIRFDYKKSILQKKKIGNKHILNDLLGFKTSRLDRVSAKTVRLNFKKQMLSIILGNGILLVR